MTLKKGEAEHRFDFTFTAATIDPARPRHGRHERNAARRPPRERPRPQPAAPPPLVGSVPAAPAIAELPPPTPAPTIPEIVEAIRARHTEIGGLVEKGDFAAVWVPAFQAKDLALALEPHLAHLLDDSRAAAEPALFRLVQGAWRLDAVGDTGNARKWSWLIGSSARPWPMLRPRSRPITNAHAAR